MCSVVKLLDDPTVLENSWQRWNIWLISNHTWINTEHTWQNKRSVTSLHSFQNHTLFHCVLYSDTPPSEHSDMCISHLGDMRLSTHTYIHKQQRLLTWSEPSPGAARRRLQSVLRSPGVRMGWWSSLWLCALFQARRSFPLQPEEHNIYISEPSILKPERYFFWWITIYYHTF